MLSTLSINSTNDKDYFGDIYIPIKKITSIQLNKKENSYEPINKKENTSLAEHYNSLNESINSSLVALDYKLTVTMDSGEVITAQIPVIIDKQVELSYYNGEQRIIKYNQDFSKPLLVEIVDQSIKGCVVSIYDALHASEEVVLPTNNSNNKYEYMDMLDIIHLNISWYLTETMDMKIIKNTTIEDIHNFVREKQEKIK